MKINHRHYTLILCALGTIMLSAFAYYFVYKTITTQAKHYIQTVSRVNNEDSKARREEELNIIYNKTVDDRAKLATFFVYEDKIVDFIEMMEKVGRDSGVLIELTAISNDKEKVKATLNAKGTWAGVMESLILLENLPVGAIIKNLHLDVTTSESAKDANKWSMTLGIEALLRK